MADVSFASLVLGFSEPHNVAKFLADPKAHVAAAGLNPDDPEVAKTLEAYARSLSVNVSAANELIGIAPIRVQWGIGASCCNGTITVK
jgi:hypothetical protein